MGRTEKLHVRISNSGSIHSFILVIAKYTYNVHVHVHVHILAGNKSLE